MKVLKNGDRVVSPEEWNTTIKPALENNVKAINLLEEIKSVKTDKTNFENNSSISPQGAKL